MRNDDGLSGREVFGISSFVVLALMLLVALSMWGCPRYEVYQRTLTGQAELKQATWNRQIKVQEAEAAQEAAKHLAQAEIERARGVAEANRIIGESLKGNEDYLRYLWIHNLESAEKNGAEVIYVPTEANLPILESTRRLRDGNGDQGKPKSRE